MDGSVSTTENWIKAQIALLQLHFTAFRNYRRII